MTHRLGDADPIRVAALFDALADLDPSEAARRLAIEAGSNAALRDAVSVLLANDRLTDDQRLHPRADLGLVLGELPTNVGPRTAVSPSNSTADPGTVSTSARLGRFYVLHKLGEGGMGVVYVGYDEGLDRKVALKLLHRGTLQGEWLRREGQALARLAHPNIVAVHEVGEHDGRLFLAMELIEGLTLRAWLSAQPRSFSEILSMFLQTGRGLASAHEAGLVHRDFKPENVLVGHDGRARVVDFGIVALAEAARERQAGSEGETEAGTAMPTTALRSPLTRSDVLMGTPAFMSPEQFRRERATALSDQFSFGVALYAAVYGVAPFVPSSKTGAREPFLELENAVLTGRAPLPPRRPGVPSWLAPIILRAISFAPEDRYRSMNALLAAIEEHVPRDPELDPNVVADEREMVTWLFLVACLAHSAPLLTETGARFMTQPWVLIGLNAAVLSAGMAFIATRWMRISKNLYGRRFAGMFPVALGALLLHRAVALAIGTPGARVLAGDLVVMATFLAVIGLTQDRWVGWLALVAGVAAAIAAVVPDHSPTAFGLAGLLAGVGLMVRVFVDRNLAQEARDAARRNNLRG